MSESRTQEFAAGDVVYLKSGSPPLTVKGSFPSGALVVSWFTGRGTETDVFNPACLTKTKPAFSAPPSP